MDQQRQHPGISFRNRKSEICGDQLRGKIINTDTRPKDDTMDKLQSMEIQECRTDKQGTVTVTSDGQKSELGGGTVY